jgi:diguanylate cyclase (GGDEF)-like protein/PAS domain S-box-containing protein
MDMHFDPARSRFRAVLLPLGLSLGIALIGTMAAFAILKLTDSFTTAVDQAKLNLDTATTARVSAMAMEKSLYHLVTARDHGEARAAAVAAIKGASFFDESAQRLSSILPGDSKVAELNRLNEIVRPIRLEVIKAGMLADVPGALDRLRVITPTIGQINIVALDIQRDGQDNLVEVSKSVARSGHHTIWLFGAIICLIFGGTFKVVLSNLRLQATQQRYMLQLQESNSKLEATAHSLKESEERYRQLVELLPDAILVAQEQRIIFANPAALRLFSAATPEELLGKSLVELVVASDGRQAPDGTDPLAMGPQSFQTSEETALRLDGSQADVVVTRLVFQYQHQEALQLTMHDVSERKKLENKLAHQSTHDGLTGLPNRSLFMDRLRQAAAEGRRHKREFVVAFIDLDRFKWVNDSLGHDIGDALLNNVATRLRDCLRESDTAARLGGDEFVLLLQGASMLQATPVLQRVVDTISLPMQIGQHEVTVTCSLGCSAFPSDGDTPDALLRYADAAMYCAKQAGRNNLQVYNDSLRQRVDKRLQMETELRHAIERKQLTLHYQPQVDLKTGALVGLEALLRWQHPSLGMVEPGRFIPLAEETGLIIPIGAWVLRQACRQNSAWQAAGMAPLPVAVNVSAKQFARPGFDVLVRDCLEQSGLDGTWLELEITESAMMQDLEQAIPLMHALKRIGVGLAIDDFGTGFSNMQYLSRLPLDRLKLDGSFVRQITHDPNSFSIANAIIAMGHSLNLKVVAEHPETEGQVRLLRARGCDHAQGHYFSRALPHEQITALLSAGPRLPLPEDIENAMVERTLLILDDDPNITAALKRLLRHEGYHIVVAHDVKVAFELMASTPAAVVLSDHRLNGDINGVQFLQRLKVLHPSAIRLILTGHPDLDMATAAINQSAVHKFISKPWDDAELRATILACFAQHDRLLAEFC